MKQGMTVITTGHQEFWFTVCLTEGEARTMVALFGYGAEALREAHAKLGTHYMNEADPEGVHLKTLAAKMYQKLPYQISRADAARKAFFANPSGLPDSPQ